MASVDLKTIWVLALLLLVIILLSAIRICPMTRRVNSDLYRDVVYKENFSLNAADAAEQEPYDYNSFKDLIKDHRSGMITQAVDQERQDRDIAHLGKELQQVEQAFADIAGYQA